jgi:hypothetical protein
LWGEKSKSNDDGVKESKRNPEAVIGLNLRWAGVGHKRTGRME